MESSPDEVEAATCVEFLLEAADAYWLSLWESRKGYAPGLVILRCRVVWPLSVDSCVLSPANFVQLETSDGDEDERGIGR